jgi:NADH:ubiquinone oxidoreductase subunit 5 (subunit L)/multisubunit Na+/H+ antiporter MnhA subunit
MLFLDHIYLIPLLPALGAAVMFFFGRKLQKETVSAVCVGSVVLAFLIACGAVWQYTAWAPAHDHQPYEKVLYTWLGSGTVRRQRFRPTPDFCLIHSPASGSYSSPAWGC